MTAWGVVAVCGIGGGVAGPFLDGLSLRVRRPVAPDAGPLVAADASQGSASLVGIDGSLVGIDGPPAVAQSQSTATATASVPVSRSREARALEAGVVAVVTAGACALAAVRLGAVPQLAAYCVLAGALVVVSVTDLRTGLVPRRFVYAAAAVVGAALLAASAADGTWRPMLDALGGAAIAFVVFSAVWWVSPKAMGFGDVRLAGLCGGALGWLGLAALYLGFLAAFVSGTCFGVAVLLAHGRRRFPFAPALALGTMFGVLWGVWLGGLWLHVR